jgi:hypothetical protein|tara:strand:+ start:765 stop:1109 length:345 start_codon:yes stop_codon:yes gene_type:complete
MKILDISDSSRINRNPDQRIILLSNGDSIQNEFIIKHLELRRYSTVNPQKSTSYSIITAYLETEIHSIEAMYDEGDLENNALENSVELLTRNLGLSGLILRLTISLKNILKNEQ